MYRCPRTVNTVGCKRTMCWQLLCVTQCGGSFAFELHRGRKRRSPEKEESHKGCGFCCVPALKIRESFQKKRCCDQCPGKGTLCVIWSCACWVWCCVPALLIWGQTLLVNSEPGCRYRDGGRRLGNAVLSYHKHFSVFSLWDQSCTAVQPQSVASGLA